MFITLPHQLSKRGTCNRFEKKRVYSAQNFEVFQKELNVIDWSMVYNTQDMNGKYPCFSNIVGDVHDKCFPSKSVKINPMKDSKPWISLGILNCARKKNSLHKQYMKARNDRTLNKYKRYKNKLVKKIPTGSHTATDFLTGNYCNSMFFSPTTTEEVGDIINNLKNSNSTGVDNISVELIKACGSILSPILSHINNYFLVSGVFPDALKIAKVVPVFKNGDAKCISNYRPISVLPTLSKITERIVYNRLSKYLSDHSILHSNQFGFREKLSTSMALLELIDKLTEAADNKLTSIGVFIDLAKAFDTVNHKILLCKLEHYGIRGIQLSWFRSYLTNRKQYVVILSRLEIVLRDYWK